MRRLASRAPLFTDAPMQNHSAFIQLSFLIEKVWTMLDFQKEELCLWRGVRGAELKVAKQNQNSPTKIKYNRLTWQRKETKNDIHQL